VALRVIVVGIPGVGKTTVVQGVVSGLPGTKLVTFGTLMFQAAKSLKWVKDRDEMRKMPVERQKRLQKMAATRIASMKGKTILVDTHLFIRTPEGFWPGLPFEVVRAMKPTHLVLIIATPEEIAMRRSADPTRARDEVTVEGLREEIEIARSFLTVSSTLTGAPMLIVRNEQGKAEEVSKSIVRMLEQAKE
jgi:adenylate kinase